MASTPCSGGQQALSPWMAVSPTCQHRKACGWGEQQGVWGGCDSVPVAVKSSEGEKQGQK